MARPLQWLGLVLKGVLVGFGAIMPGISGGTLCVAFGMYKPILSLLSHPRQTLRTHGIRLFFFIAGGGLGFIGLSGLVGWLMERNSPAVICAFLGFILGTLPELWQDAGRQGRRPSSYASLALSFVLFLGLLLLLKYAGKVTLPPGLGSFFLCGLLWGLSFVVPGLSSSTLLIFFGLYQPMLEGIAHLSLPVCIPLALGAALCLLTLPRLVERAYQRWYAQVSHAILGIMLASVVMVIPFQLLCTPGQVLLGLACAAGGCLCSLLFARLLAPQAAQKGK